MKVWVYGDGQSGSGIYLFKEPVQTVCGYDLLGTLDLDVKPEKKWVKKETVLSYEDMVTSADQTLDNVFVPKGARNLTLSYEVEE
jgi:hypothetical protein